MIRSMTGYGDAERDTPAGRIRLEVKTVNHRFFNANIKTPPGFSQPDRGFTSVEQSEWVSGLHLTLAAVIRF